MSKHAPHAGSARKRSRKQRPRPTPKWLKDRGQLNAIARSRCLMLLSVLSGEKPVTEAIAEAKISRGTYYQMETRALHAMLAALNPIPAAAKSEEPDLRPRIQELNERIRRLEQDKRRTQRLLLLTRKSAWAPLTAPWRGRLPKSVWPGWTPSGSASSESSETSQETTNHSIPTKGGASEC